MYEFIQKLQRNKLTNTFNTFLLGGLSLLLWYLLIDFLGTTNLLPYDASNLSYFSIALLDILFLGLPFFLLFLSLTYVGFKYVIKPSKSLMILFLTIFAIPSLILMRVSINTQNYYLLVNDLMPLVGIMCGYYIVIVNKKLQRN